MEQIKSNLDRLGRINALGLTEADFDKYYKDLESGVDPELAFERLCLGKQFAQDDRQYVKEILAWGPMDDETPPN